MFLNLRAPIFQKSPGDTTAYYFYDKDEKIPDRLAVRWNRLYLFSLNKGFVDELYDRLFVRPTLALGWLFWKKGDGQIIDRFGPDGVMTASLRIARFMGHLQTGYVYQYAFAMLVGIVALVSALALWLLMVKGS